MATTSGTPAAHHASTSATSWILDSGANEHITGESSLFISTSAPTNPHVRIADGSLTNVRCTGTIPLSSQITLDSVLHVPEFTLNLLSVSRLAKSLNCAVVFLSHSCYLQDLSTRQIFGKGYERDGLYYFGDKKTAPLSFHASVLPESGRYVFSSSSLKTWHARLGHVNFQYLCTLFPALIKACKQTEFHCEICALSKHVRNSYIPRMHRSPDMFDLIHSDVWGPSPVVSLSGHRYYVTFIDDHTRCTWVYLLRKKSEVLPLFTQFLQLIKTQFNRVVKCIRSDNAKEYVSAE